MMTNQTRILAIGLFFSLLISCTNTNQRGKDKYGGKETNTSIIKVLNRVTCKDSSSYCPQENINLIWKSCLNDGYTTTVPSVQVTSSRDLKELTNYNYQVTKKRANMETDSNGIVYESENQVSSTQENYTIQGYCIGSEYIIDK